MNCNRHLVLQRRNHHLDLVIESDGRCVDSRHHETAIGCEESTNVDDEGCESVVGVSENGRAARSMNQ